MCRTGGRWRRSCCIDERPPHRRPRPMSRSVALDARLTATVSLALLLLLSAAFVSPPPVGSSGPPESVRFATFNASLNRNSAGQALADLSAPGNAQASAVAEIIQRTRPEVLLINEF